MKKLETVKREKQLEEIEKKQAMELQKKKMAKRLKETLWANGLTQAKFAEACGISHETLKKYLSGEHFIRVDMLIPIAKQLDVSFEYLLCVDTDGTTNETTPIAKRIKNATNLSDDAISTLLDLKNKKDYTECISTIIENKTILDKLVKYFLFLNHKEWMEYPDGFESIDVDNVYLYQTMKELEKSIKRKVNK